LGISIVWRFVHPEKHSCSIDLIRPWNTMDKRDEHPGKQWSGRSLTNLGISIDWRFLHPKKHFLPNDCIESGKNIWIKEYKLGSLHESEFFKQKQLSENCVIEIGKIIITWFEIPLYCSRFEFS
jgi:hypothetical protein